MTDTGGRATFDSRRGYLNTLAGYLREFDREISLSRTGVPMLIVTNPRIPVLSDHVLCCRDVDGNPRVLLAVGRTPRGRGGPGDRRAGRGTDAQLLIDRKTVWQAGRLIALKIALENRHIVTRLDVLPIPLLMVPMLSTATRERANFHPRPPHEPHACFPFRIALMHATLGRRPGLLLSFVPICPAYGTIRGGRPVAGGLLAIQLIEVYGEEEES